MTDSNYTHLLIVADRSGSMFNIADDMNGAIAAMLKEQAALPGQLLVDAWTFDDLPEQVGSNLAADDGRLTYLITPRGSTALFDGVGKAVTDLGATLAQVNEDARPGKVIVVVVTDGHENASHEWTKDAVKQLLTQQQEQYAWQVVFLGANIDSASVGAGIGLRGASTMDYMPTAQGVSRAFLATSSVMSAYRTGATANMAYEKEDEDEE